MVLKPDEINEIRRLKAERKTVEEIENKTGYSHTSIVKYTKNSQPPSPPSKTTSPLGKNPEIPQAQTDQITLHKILTAVEKTQHPTTDNIPDFHYQRLEERVNQLEQSKQTQDLIKDYHLKEQENKLKSEEMKQQHAQPPVSPSSASDFQQLPKIDQDQTVVPSQDLENEPPDIIDHLYNNLPGIIKGLIETKPLWSKLVNDFGTFQKTGFFPSEDYIQYAKKKSDERKTKKETIIIVPLNDVKPIQESPAFPKTNTGEQINVRSDSNQHSNDRESQKNYVNNHTSGIPCSGEFVYNCSGLLKSDPAHKKG